MPADTKTKRAGGDEQDDDVELPDQEAIAERFAEIEERSSQGAHIELPPVPDVQFERPKPKEPKAGNAGTLMAGGLAGRIAANVGNSGENSGGDGSSLGNVNGIGKAMTIGTSLVASIVVGTGLGWAADKYLLHSGSGTPWGLIVGFLFGVASGFINLVRIANDLNR